MDHEPFITRINRKTQALFGRTTLVALLAWAALSIAFLNTASDDTTTATFIFFFVGTLLLALFLMRLVVLIRGKPLFNEVQAHLTSNALSLDSLVLQARSMEPRPEFFLSLVAGPLAARRQAKEQQ